ncbi:aminotransferase class IV [Aspergillus homomorphus CBS 101889]|uniref:D-aminoacid aminotransferase-like PLP-dependent enzyme n=1 Tax=Aspergillus homomorphus (strain CBS 101889) TaxID=1450537 RepID=A0A395I524_ASPHC|nr:D-aminoacid aminotransferase-like PLP-dependent enzyme [Aspergillus homomorphus CBS 101889]RAL14856.1 D-aminoacid aminotransferase-like PLP-dependent enzyme [Aspergillus homomorphus CBS 101889]
MTTMDKIFAGYSARKATLEANTDNPFTKGIAWIEGTFTPLHQARIPLLDEGFLRGDLTYDVPGVWDGRFFRLDDHLSRLELSCAKLRMRLPVPRDEITRILLEMLSRSGIRDAYVELIVTRGLEVVRGKDPFTLTNNLYLFIKPYFWVMEPEMQRTGGDAIIARTVRRVPPGAIDPTVKNLQWGDLIRGCLEAADRGAAYPFLTDGDAHLTEGAGYNVVLVKDRVIYTADRGVLHGVTHLHVYDGWRDYANHDPGWSIGG